MEFKPLSIPGLVLITPKVFGDSRGFFKETYNREEFKANGIDIDFGAQSNHSRSSKGVLRGLHWQKEPFAQDKLVRVATGRVLDVAVDIRVGSPTFGQYEAVELSDENHNIFLIPKGFAHGFLVLSETADFEYKVSAPYNKESESALLWNDPKVGIKWGFSEGEQPLLSEKDLANKVLKDIDSEDLFKFVRK